MTGRSSRIVIGLAIIIIAMLATRQLAAAQQIPTPPACHLLQRPAPQMLQMVSSSSYPSQSCHKGKEGKVA
jgi:hypothetical protein